MWHCAAELLTDFALHMTEKQLMKRFKACMRYSQAKPWHKPFLNFRRFFRNQLRKHSIGVAPAGELRTTKAFHLDHFTIVNGEGVGEQIASYGVFEGNLTEAFLRLVRPGQVVVEMAYAGLCHSDEHLRVDSQRYPIVGGHEGAGTVTAVGDGVTGVRPGDHVVTTFLPACGHCRWHA